MKLISRGATLTEWHVPDKNGKMADVVFGFDDVAGYESKGNGYFGCTTGRVANRIAGGKFTLDGKEYQLAKNDGPNALHGGGSAASTKSCGKASRSRMPTGQGVVFTYTSPDGEEGYPGKLTTQGHLHAHRQERAPDRLRGDDRQGHADQSHESRLLQSGRRGSPTI